MYICIKYRPRFFDQVGHQTTYASIRKRHLDISSNRQTYQNYDQCRQKIGHVFRKESALKIKVVKKFHF